MKIPSHHTDNASRDDLAMTPMIDVVFLLLIFFVCASVGQIRESLLPTDLAAGGVQSPDAEAPPPPFGDVWLYLRVDETGQTTVQINEGGEIYSDLARVEQQMGALAQATTEIPVILDIDGGVSLGDVVTVLDACRAARFETINFAMEPTAETAPAAE